MILGIQIIGVLFGIFMMYLSFIYKKRKEFTFNEWAFWSFLSVVFIFISLFPDVLDPVVKSLNIARTMDLFIILGFMFLIGAMFYTYTVTRRNQKMLEEVVRKIAFERVEKIKRKK